MKQKKIKYIDVMSLGFSEETLGDEIFKNKYGYEYTIVTKQLSDNIFIDWSKRTRFCNLFVEFNGGIIAEVPVFNKKHLKSLIKKHTHG